MFAGDRVTALVKWTGFWVGRNCGLKIGYWVRSVFSWTVRTLITEQIQIQLKIYDASCSQLYYTQHDAKRQTNSVQTSNCSKECLPPPADEPYTPTAEFAPANRLNQLSMMLATKAGCCYNYNICIYD